MPADIDAAKENDQSHGGIVEKRERVRQFKLRRHPRQSLRRCAALDDGAKRGRGRAKSQSWQILRRVEFVYDVNLNTKQKVPRRRMATHLQTCRAIRHSEPADRPWQVTALIGVEQRQVAA